LKNRCALRAAASDTTRSSIFSRSRSRYAISGERTLEAFYERLQPFALPFMALFGRDRLPARSTLSRFLSSLTQATAEALRSLFLDDLLARPLGNEQQRTPVLGQEGLPDNTKVVTGWQRGTTPWKGRMLPSFTRTRSTLMGNSFPLCS